MGKWLDANYSKFFQKYSDEELVNDLNKYLNDNGRCSKFLSHFFDEEIYKCVGAYGQPDNKDFPNKNPMDFLLDDRAVAEAIRYTKSKPKFFTGDEIANIKSFFRNRRPRKVTNFPIIECKRIFQFLSPEVGNALFGDNKEVNIHDSSCGFGSRMVCAMLANKNYFGTDPNKLLFAKLNEAADFIHNHMRTNSKVDIRCQGSETFIPEWKNTMDLSFTSPPYFNLEIYSDDKCSSTANYDNYELWLSKFVEPSIDNCIRYLKINGKLAINIKNLSKKLPLFDDYASIISEHSNMHREKDLDLSIRNKSWNYASTFNEPIMVFTKVSE